jgi:hypothetical protein
MHGLSLRVDGDLPIPATNHREGGPVVEVHVQRRPPWGDSPLDPTRVTFSAGAEGTAGAVIDVGWTSCGNGVRVRFAEGVTFWVSASWDRIWLEYLPPLTPADAAYFLVEPVLAFVLRRRGELALHASAVAFAQRGVAFCGASGSGKSTLAGACVMAGAGLISDDVTAVAVLGGEWVAHRGTGAIRLWDDGAGAFGDLGRKAPVFSPTWEKRVMSPESLGGTVASAATPLQLLCVLDGLVSNGQPATLTPLAGAEAATAVIANASAGYLHDAATRALELSQAASLASLVRVVRLAVPRGDVGMRGVANAVRAALGD